MQRRLRVLENGKERTDDVLRMGIGLGMCLIEELTICPLWRCCRVRAVMTMLNILMLFPLFPSLTPS